MNALRFICFSYSINLLCGLGSFLFKVSSEFAVEQAMQRLTGEVAPHFVIFIADSVPKRCYTGGAATKLLLKITENRQAISDVLCQNIYRKLRKDFWITNLF